MRRTSREVKMSGIFRIVAETATCFGTGFLGLGYILIQGNSWKIAKYVTLSTIGAGIVYTIIQRNRQKRVGERNLIVITGCDSGLGQVTIVEFEPHLSCFKKMYLHFFCIDIIWHYIVISS